MERLERAREKAGGILPDTDGVLMSPVMRKHAERKARRQERQKLATVARKQRTSAPIHTAIDTSGISSSGVGGSAIERLLRTNPALVKKLVDKAKAEKSLASFIQQYWRVVEPSTPLVWGWVMDAICMHLEAVSDGRLKKIIINVPPGFCKSLITNVFWPAWEWATGKAGERYICISYSQTLTIRDNRRFLRLVNSKEYQDNWKIELDQESVVNVSNAAQGWKLAGSLGSGITGQRGSKIILDDANNVAESESELILETTNLFLREVMPDRLSDMQTGAIVSIQQRTSELDATGTLLDMDVGYDHMMVPMEYDSRRHCVTSIGWSDPRTMDGELAWPERFPREVVENMKASKGPYAYHSQYQQSPAPRGGGILKREWWNLWPPEGYPVPEDGKLRFPDNMSYIIASCDTAYTKDEENDPSACVVFGVFEMNGIPRVVMMEAWAAHLEFDALQEKIIKTCRKREVDMLLIEGKASGKSIIQEIRRKCSTEKFSVHEVRPDGDKIARTHAVVPMFANGCIYAPDRDWSETVINQCSVFPKGKHDDLHDAVTQAIFYLRKTGIALLSDEGERIITESMSYENISDGERLYDV